MAKRHGVSYDTLIKKAAKQGWHPKKKKRIARLIRDALNKSSATESEKLASLREAADGMGEVISGILKDTEQFKRYIIRSKSGFDSDTQERIFQKYDTTAIRDITASIKNLTVSVRNLYQLLTAPEKSAMDIASARLLLDQTKASLNSIDQTELGVVQIAEVLPDDEKRGRG